MTKKNQDIRKKARDNGIPLWMIAGQLGVSEFTFIRHLRNELSESQKAEVMNALDILIEVYKDV